MLEIWTSIGWVQSIALATVLITPMLILAFLASQYLNQQHKLKEKEMDQTHEMFNDE